MYNCRVHTIFANNFIFLFCFFDNGKCLLFLKRSFRLLLQLFPWLIRLPHPGEDIIPVIFLYIILPDDRIDDSEYIITDHHDPVMRSHLKEHIISQKNGQYNRGHSQHTVQRVRGLHKAGAVRVGIFLWQHEHAEKRDRKQQKARDRSDLYYIVQIEARDDQDDRQD